MLAAASTLRVVGSVAAQDGGGLYAGSVKLSCIDFVRGLGFRVWGLGFRVRVPFGVKGVGLLLEYAKVMGDLVFET